LLLTFFYRQMPELIERGHIYIAQPPLYKVKKGKQEQYVKDDVELNSWLLKMALDGTGIRTSEAGPTLTGVGLETLAAQYMVVMGITRRLARRYSSELLESMIYMPPLHGTTLHDHGALQGWFAELVQRLNATQSAEARYTAQVEFDADEKTFRAHINKHTHGNAAKYVVSNDLFNSSEYHAILDLGRQLDGLLGTGATAQRGERSQLVTSFKQAIEWLLDEAKRGLHIQRYKGLGEMNPEQLWETTMDPETRRLLRVRIEDAVASDEVFTTLMGDQVEPRREFIERNALAVSNLDI
jgi:DNA gyrase subunit B